MIHDIADSVVAPVLVALMRRGADDWVMLSELDYFIKSAARQSGHELDADERRAVGMKVLRRAFDEGLAVAGDVDDGFCPWDVSPTQALDTISRGWDKAGDALEMGDVCWVCNTPLGDAYATNVSAE